MYDEARTILMLFKKKGYEAYYIGGKCRNELHGKYHPETKIEVKDIDIITNATKEQIQAIFPNSNLRGESFQVVVVNFGGNEFEIATYRKDIYNAKEIKESKKVVKPDTIVVDNLDEDRARRDYTINAIAQNDEDKYIDYVYEYRNKKISAIQDIENKIIRAIGNPKQRFEEDPLRILRAFRLIAQLNYEIEKQTFKAIENNIKLIEKIPHERISMEMNKILLGKFASKALGLMKSVGLFNLTIFNGIKKSQTTFLPGMNEIDNEYFKIIDTYNRRLSVKQTPSLIELWALLLKPLGIEKIRQNLESIYPLNLNDIEKVEWIVEYWDIINKDDYKTEIYNARTGVVQKYKLMCMKELLKKICRIHTIVYGEEYDSKSRKLMDTFCSRPYFPEQLRVTGEDLMKIANEEPGPWISVAKEKLILKLVNTEKFPKEDEKYNELVQESVEEAIFEESMKSEGLI